MMIREGLTEEEATRRFWAIDSRGLLTDNYPGTLRDFQQPYARPAAEIAAWPHDHDDSITLADVVANANPTMLIGTSTQSGAFTEGVVRHMAATVDRPSSCRCPTRHRRRGSPRRSDPLDRRPRARGHRQPLPTCQLRRADLHHRPVQQRTGLPGLGLGVAVVRARRITDAMIAAAADAVAAFTDPTGPGAALLPPVTDLRTVSAAVAIGSPPPKNTA